MHGYVFKEFSDRPLADLEDEEQRSGKHMDQPKSVALNLHVEFSHARIDLKTIA